MPALQCIFKLNNFCNLDCSYCYQSYSNYKALNLKRRTFEQGPLVACARAAIEIALSEEGRQRVPHFSFVLQGGEPLLVGKRRMEQFLAALRRLESEYDVPILLTVHSNGVGLDHDWCEILLRFSSSLTVSLDGPAEFHDRTRYDRRGRPTHTKVLAGVHTAINAGVDTGCMCVVSPFADGTATQIFFGNLGITRLGYLLPTAQSRPIVGTGGYGRFLKDAFDVWLDSKIDGVRVQFFEAAFRALAGKPSGLAGVGGYPAEWLSFTADGAVEAGDPFGLIYFSKIEGLPTEAIRKAQDNPFYRLQATGGFVPNTGPCGECRVRSMCQGGFLAHRYDGAQGFDQPSYYCADLLEFYTHVQLTVAALRS